MHHFSTALSEQHRSDLLSRGAEDRLARSVSGAPAAGRGRRSPRSWGRPFRGTRASER